MVEEVAFARAKRGLALALAAIACGLAVSGSLPEERATGGVLLLAGWLGAVASLHRLGRSGAG